jgi:hypothetical protein
MRITSYILIILVCFSTNIYSNDIKISNESNSVKVIDKSSINFKLITSVNKISTNIIKTKFGNFVKLSIPSYTSNSIDGNPELPSLNKLISVPKGAKLVTKIINKIVKTVSLEDYGIELPLFPNQPSISKGDNNENIDFIFNKDSYNQNSFSKFNVISTELLGFMRDIQLARISVSPISYNPITNELKIITNLEIEVSFIDIDFTADKLSKQKYYSADFEHLYKKCINYLPSNKKDVITTYPVKYVIVSDPIFQTALQPLVDWKTKKGFTVIEAYTNNPNVGSTTTSIKSYLQNMYDSATINNPAPTYLLIVGDDNQVPSFVGAQHVSDMYYCEFDGNGDFYPEMYFGRFSANTVSEVEIQVAKTLTHEKYLFSDPSFLNNVVLVAGVDASYAPTYGNGQINYATDNYFNIAHNLTIHNYLYGSGTPITSDMSQASTSIISNVSEGVGLANYSAHCGPSGWSDPSFNSSDVSGLQNIDEYGLIISNCCTPNKFDEPVCFGEALLRADNKGALGHIGASNNTYWDEDYWWSVGSTSNITANPTYSGTGLGAYDCLMHENGEQEEDWFITQSQIIHAGNLSVTEAGGAEQYYWEIYHLMGDPSLMPYIGIPTSLSVSHNSVLPIGSTSLVVNSEENSYVALSMNGILLDAQLCDASGVVNLVFNPISNVGSMDVVVTQQFKQPYLSTLQVISPNGPYIISTNDYLSDINGNNNSLADYNELVNLTVDLFNLGGGNAQNLNLVLSTTDQYITIIDSIDNINLINSSQSASSITPFSFQVAAYVPDQHIALCLLTISDNLGNIWTSDINITLNSPVLSHLSVSVNDAVLGNGNGKLDAGENLELVIEVNNTGHADAYNLLGTLSSLSSYITINNSSFSLLNLNINQIQNLIFNISVDQNAPTGTSVIFPFNITDQTYSHQTDFSENIGVIDEDYETGDFSNYSWIQGTFPWIVDDVELYEGVYSSRSAVVLPDNEESELSIIVNVLANGDISFYKFVSSELDFDFLKFKINGSKVGEWSGIDSIWSFVSFPVNTGVNTFKWEYDKDASWNDGQDGAWIDYIVFPPIYINQTSITEANLDINIFPNPNKGIFNIVINDDQQHSIEITDLNGKRIDVIQGSAQTKKFDMTQYSAGTYMIKILPENIIYQIVKQ